MNSYPWGKYIFILMESQTKLWMIDRCMQIIGSLICLRDVIKAFIVLRVEIFIHLEKSIKFKLKIVVHLQVGTSQQYLKYLFSQKKKRWLIYLPYKKLLLKNSCDVVKFCLLHFAKFLTKAFTKEPPTFARTWQATTKDEFLYNYLNFCYFP